MLDTEFLDALASKAPTPGGGGASAYAGALAVALSSMVINLSIGKKKFAPIEEILNAHLGVAETTRKCLLGLIDKDAEAFGALAATWKMPKETEEERAAQHAAEQAALVDAIEVPLSIMSTCNLVVDMADYLARNASRMAVSDAGASAVLAAAACRAASLNIFINAPAMDDRDKAAAYEAQALEISERCSQKAEEVFAFTMDIIKK